MRQVDGNPATNALGPGVNEDDVSKSISVSGYPLQVLVAKWLQNHDFYVQQEWSYIDSDSGALRAIDCLAVRDLWSQERSQPRARPYLALAVECKQSPLPYAFFAAGAPQPGAHFPLISGLAFDDIQLFMGRNRTSLIVSILSALSLDHDPFLTSAPPVSCHTFSKCVRKGQALELSGSDIYSAVVVPLVKAVRHFKITEEPVETAHYFDMHITIPLAVIDAPLIAVELDGASHSLVLTPWVRLYRHEYFSQADRFDRQQLLAIDIVHKDFLDTYLTKHLDPFASRLADVAMKNHHVVADGQGFLSESQRGFDDLRDRLRPSKRKRRERVRHVAS